MKDDKELKQDLNQRAQIGGPFIMRLFFRERIPLPDKEKMTEIMAKHLGEVECINHDEKGAGFAIKKYQMEFKDGKMPPLLSVMDCAEMRNYSVDDFTLSQMWDCPECREILAQCPYQALAIDMMGSSIPEYKDRADMLMDYLEALMEIYPECVAVIFDNSGKMFARDRIVGHQIPRNNRFVYFAVNARFFNIQGTGDYLVDTLGMGTLRLPDLQYHFRGMDPNWVVNHAYNMLSFLYHNNASIKSGDTIDGIVDGHMEQSVQWKCQHEKALVPPARQVIDICMNEYAAKRG